MAPPHQQDGAVMTMAASEASPNFTKTRNMINVEKPSLQSAMEAPIHLFRSKLPDITIPDHLPLTEFCLENSRNSPEKPCLIETSKNGKTYTYGEVELYSKRVTAGLSQMGIKQQDVIMLMIPNSAEFVLLFLGAASLGAAITTCNPFYKEGEIEKQVKGSCAKLIVTQIAHVEKISPIVSQHNLQVVVIDDYDKFHMSSLPENVHHVSTLLNANEEDSPHIDIHPDDVVALPFSSGTTGLPKGVMLSHKGLVTSISQQVDGENPTMNFTSDDVILCVLPMFHIYSLSIVLCCLRVGAALAIMPKFEIEALFDVVQRYCVSIAPLVPPIVLALTKNPLVEKYDLSSIRMVMSGAAPLGKDLQDAFKARVPGAIIAQGYGMTEAGSVLSMSLAFAKHPFPVKSGSCGTVLRNAVVKLIDPETGMSLGYNQPGEICIKGSQIMKGYLNDDVATQNTIDKDGFLHTGDIGIIDDDDELFIVDRVKEIIKYKGFQVAPAELEGILLSHPSVFDAACVPKKDESAGEIPIAFVVPTQGAEVTELELKEFVSSQVIFYKKLHKIIFVDSIPKSPSGKILRRELRKRLEEGGNM